MRVIIIIILQLANFHTNVSSWAFSGVLGAASLSYPRLFWVIQQYSSQYGIDTVSDFQ